jgi:hypothetical protein
MAWCWSTRGTNGPRRLSRTRSALWRRVSQGDRALGATTVHSSQPLTPLAEMPFQLRDRFAELYLNSLESQTTLRRRLSRLEATFDRQLEAATADAKAEAAEWKRHVSVLGDEIDRLRAGTAAETWAGGAG